MVSRKIRAKAAARGAPARGVRGGHRVGARPLLRAQRARSRRDDPGVRDGGLQQHAGRHGARAREQRVLRPAQPDVAVRLLHRTVEVDPETGVWDVLRVVAVDDCGVRINPMIVEGQIMGGLTEAYAMANMQFITFDSDGNCIGANFMDYLLPTAWETPGFELHEVVTPCPHHPIGAKGVGECATVGGPAAFVERGDGRDQGHRCAQHRHAVAPGSGVRGAHRAPRRVGRASGEGRQLT